MVDGSIIAADAARSTPEDVWRSNSEALADWSGQINVFWKGHGRYVATSKRSPGRGHVWTAKYKSTTKLRRRHFAGDDGFITGLHFISPKNRCARVAWDIDNHERDPQQAQVNFAAARVWFDRLREIGCNPILLESSPGSYHLQALFAPTIYGPIGFSFGRWLIRDWQELGLPCRPESFPKRPQLDQLALFGSWLRLPGRHHTLTDFWSPAWDGTRWLDAAGTVRLLLTTAPTDPELLPREARSYNPNREAARTLQAAPASAVSTGAGRKPPPAAPDASEAFYEPDGPLPADIASLPPDVVPHVLWAIGAMRPRKRHDVYWNLYPRLLGTSLGTLPLEKHISTLEVLYRHSHHKHRTQDFDECAGDYRRAAKYFSYPTSGDCAGGLWALEWGVDCVSRLPKELLPAIPRMREDTRRLAALCRIRGRRGTFTLPLLELARILGMPKQRVWDQISALQRSKFIRCVSAPRWGRGGGYVHGGRLGVYRLGSS